MKPETMYYVTYEPLLPDTKSIYVTIAQGRTVRERFRIATKMLADKYYTWLSTWTKVEEAKHDIQVHERLIEDQREVRNLDINTAKLCAAKELLLLYTRDMTVVEQELDAIVDVIMKLDTPELKKDIDVVDMLGDIVLEAQADQTATQMDMSSKLVNDIICTASDITKDADVPNFEATLSAVLGSERVKTIIGDADVK